MILTPQLLTLYREATTRRTSSARGSSKRSTLDSNNSIGYIHDNREESVHSSPEDTMSEYAPEDRGRFQVSKHMRNIVNGQISRLMIGRLETGFYKLDGEFLELCDELGVRSYLLGKDDYLTMQEFHINMYRSRRTCKNINLHLCGICGLVYAAHNIVQLHTSHLNLNYIFIFDATEVYINHEKKRLEQHTNYE